MYKSNHRSIFDQRSLMIGLVLIELGPFSFFSRDRLLSYERVSSGRSSSSFRCLFNNFSINGFSPSSSDLAFYRTGDSSSRAGALRLSPEGDATNCPERSVQARPAGRGHQSLNEHIHNAAGLAAERDPNQAELMKSCSHGHPRGILNRSAYQTSRWPSLGNLSPLCKLSKKKNLSQTNWSISNRFLTVSPANVIQTDVPYLIQSCGRFNAHSSSIVRQWISQSQSVTMMWM